MSEVKRYKRSTHCEKAFSAGDDGDKCYLRKVPASISIEKYNAMVLEKNDEIYRLKD